MLSKATVLVTGASGQLGRRLVTRLLALGAKVRAHYRSCQKVRFCPQGATAVIGDLLSPDWVDEAVSGCDYVIHGAAKVSLRPMPLEPMRSINVGGTQAIVEACRRLGVKRVLYVSSTAAIGGSLDGTPLDETAPFNLAGFGVPYFETKRQAEELALAANGGMLEVVVVNPSIMIAAPDHAIAPAELKVPRWLPFYVDFGVNLVDTDDVVTGIVLALQKGRAGQRYILAGENVDAKRAIALASKYLSLRRPLVKLPRQCLYPLGLLAEAATLFRRRKPPLNIAIARLARFRYFYTSAKANRELGWSAIPLEESIRKIFQQLAQHGIDLARSA